MNRSSITEMICRHLTDNADRLYRLAFRYVKNEEDAMDIVQDAACKILQYQEKIKQPEYIDTMLYRVTINAALDFLRKHKRETVGLPLVEEGREDNYGRLYALDLLDVLDEKSRAIVILRFFEDRQLAEIADILHMNLNTVKTRLDSALRTLKRELDKPGL